MITFAGKEHKDMSKANNTIMGLEHGKIGDRIAVVLNGKQVYKKLYKPSNPQTPEQQKHRSKLAFANRLSKVLAEAVNRGFALVPGFAKGLTARNAFVHEIFNNGTLVWDEEHGEWGIRPELLKLAMGPRYIDAMIKAEVRDGWLHVSCPDTGMDDSHGVDDDQLIVAVYRPAVPILHLFGGPLRKECNESFYELPENEGEEDVMFVYAWFQATKYHRSSGDKITVRAGQASRSIYLGAFGLHSARHQEASLKLP